MRYNVFILLSMLALTTLFSCDSATKKQQTEAQQPAKGTNISFVPLTVSENYPLDSANNNSPNLEINISLLVPSNTTPEIEKNINNCIVNAAFGYDCMTPREAIDSVISSLRSDYYQLRNDFINEKGVNDEAGWFNTYFLLNSKVEQGRDNAICYIINNETYSGGAHPNSVTNTINIDPRTGCEITLQDIFKEYSENALIAKLISRLMQQRGAHSIGELQEEGFLSLNDMFITNNFILKKDSVIFLYNNYEIAPYYAGKSFIGFSYDELKQILK